MKKINRLRGHFFVSMALLGFFLGGSSCLRREPRPLHFDEVSSPERDIDSDEEEFSTPEGANEPAVPNTGMTIDTTTEKSKDAEVDNKKNTVNDEEDAASDEMIDDTVKGLIPEDETDVPENS